MKSTSTSQRGAVSLFLVVFATLVITVITVSFVRLMIQDQSQATDADLSQSAYDSAQAGVEDAKRSLLRYKSLCLDGNDVSCSSLLSSFNSDACNRSLTATGVVSETGNEVRVQQSTGDASLDQAYTCVKTKLDTDDYVGTLAPNESKVIPLIATGDITSVTVEWFSRDDLNSDSTAVNLGGLSDNGSLLAQNSWPSTRPSLLRTQLMQYGSNFTLGNFDTMANGQSNANTLFLYPSARVGAPSYPFTSNARASASSATPAASPAETPRLVNCKADLNEGGYACKMQLDLPEPIGGGNRTAFLRLTPFYTATHFRVTLTNNSVPVQFKAVQPEVDSTGRANSLFRRVASRVDLIDSQFPLPEAELDITGNVCKDFAVTDNAYIAGTSCTP